jgi:HSP20 family molecular chaperone IbpA
MLPTLVREKERFPFFGLRNGIDRMFDDFFSSPNDWPALVEPRMAGPNVFLPPIDVKETDTNLLVEVEVPGFKSGDVDVQIEDGVLVLRTASSCTASSCPTTSTPRRSRRRARRASSA